MKKIFIMILCVVPFAVNAQSLFKRLKDKATETLVNKGQQIAEKKIDEAANKKITAAQNQATGSETLAQPAEPNNQVIQSTAAKKLKAYSRYDFVPGQAVFYAENFEGGNLGELPSGWNSNGNGALVRLETVAGNWLKMNQHATYLSGNKIGAGKDFTVEFDLISEFKNGSYLLPSLHFGLLATGKLHANDNSFLENTRGDKTLDVMIHPGFDRGSMIYVTGYKGNGVFFSGPSQEDFTIENYGKPMHVSISLQNQRVRLWLNSNKLYDIPMAVAEEGNFNQFFFSIEGSNYKNEDINVYLGNLKMANGLPDARSKLIDEGKYSTTGILFDLNKADLKPQSYGVMNELAKILKDNPSLKLKIVGHTDSDGDAKANQELSIDRANAVRDAFVNQYGIDADRFQTEGKGSSKPVADNKTNTGKMQNRRVEFDKV